MAEARERCMICVKEAQGTKGGICEPCQDHIRREAMGEQADLRERADKELSKQGVCRPRNGLEHDIASEPQPRLKGISGSLVRFFILCTAILAL